jgi:hypothetical protein
MTNKPGNQPSHTIGKFLFVNSLFFEIAFFGHFVLSKAKRTIVEPPTDIRGYEKTRYFKGNVDNDDCVANLCH